MTNCPTELFKDWLVEIRNTAKACWHEKYNFDMQNISAGIEFSIKFYVAVDLKISLYASGRNAVFTCSIFHMST